MLEYSKSKERSGTPPEAHRGWFANRIARLSGEPPGLDLRGPNLGQAALTFHPLGDKSGGEAAAASRRRRHDEDDAGPLRRRRDGGGRRGHQVHQQVRQRGRRQDTHQRQGADQLHQVPDGRGAVHARGEGAEE